jgi:hypothetical protein
MNERALKWFLALFALAFNVALFYIIYQNLTPGSTDLYPRWIGAKMFFEGGISPYDERVGIASQTEIYGQPARPDQDQVLFAYPFYAVFYIGPLVLVSYQLAAAIYMYIMLLTLLGAMTLWLHLMHWLPSPPMLAWLILWTVVGYFSVRGVLLAQLAIIGYGGHLLAVWGIYQRWDVLAGLGLALAVIKPQTGYLIVPLLLLWALRERRWRLVGSFGAGFGLLMLGSFLLYPPWFGEWWDQIRAYENYTETLSAAQIIAQQLPDGLISLAYAGFIVGLGLPLLWVWKQILVDRQQAYFLWAYALTLLYSMSVAPRTATTYYVEFYPILYMTAWLWATQGRSWWVYTLGTGLLVGYWMLHIATVPPPSEGNDAGLEAPIVYVILPALMWVLVWVYRQAWVKQLPAPG